MNNMTVQSMLVLILTKIISIFGLKMTKHAIIYCLKSSKANPDIDCLEHLSHEMSLFVFFAPFFF